MDKSKHSLRSLVILLVFVISNFNAFSQKDIPSNQTTNNNSTNTISTTTQTNNNVAPINGLINLETNGTDPYQVRETPGLGLTLEPGSTYTNILHSTSGGSTTSSGSSSIPGSCPMMYTEVMIPFLQSCVASTAQINYWNSGTADAFDAYVDVELPMALTFDSASLPYTIVGTNVYRFQLGTVNTSTSNIFDVHFTTLCDSTLLGDEHCITAHIYPDTICNDVHDDHLITVNGDCKNGVAKYTIYNHGTAVTIGQHMQLIVIDDHLLAGGSPHRHLIDTLIIGQDSMVGFGFSPTPMYSDYKLTITDNTGMLIASSKIKNCTATTSGATVNNYHPNQFINNSHLPSTSTTCAINGQSATQTSSSLNPSFNGDSGESGTARSNYDDVNISELEIDEETVIKVFPNPFDQYATVRIEGPIADNFSFKLYDATGRTVQQLFLENQREFTLERQDLLDGMYFYQIEEQGHLIGSGKIIIK